MTRARVPIEAAAFAAGVFLTVLTQSHVTGDLYEAASLNPEQFIGCLAESGVPAGLEIRERDRPSMNPPRTAASKTPTIETRELIAEFNARHQQYVAELLRGVIVVRPRSGRSLYLDERSPAVSTKVASNMDAARKIFAPLDPSLDAPGGRVGSILGGIDLSGEKEFFVDGRGKSVLQVFGEIVTEVPTQAWLVRTNGANPPRIIAIGFVRRYGSTIELPLSPR